VQHRLWEPRDVRTRSCSPTGTTEASTVISVDEIVAHKGCIPISSRYTAKRTLESEYSVGTKVLGSGMSGPVKLAVCKADGVKYAVKTFQKKGLSAKKQEELKNEVEIYLSLDHPHVARLEMVFESEEEISLVMEHMEGGELYARLSKHKQYTEELAARSSRQMLLAVAYLHGLHLAHRDLKLENFLYEREDNNHLKLIDFGFAKFWDRSTRMTQACGSVHYVAPEVLRKSYDEKADVWSLGVIVYMLLTGCPPFRGSDKEVLKKVKEGTPNWDLTYFKRLSPQAQDFTRTLLTFDPCCRPSAAVALEHLWIKDLDQHAHVILDADISKSLWSFAHAASFKRAVLSMMAWSLSSEDRAELRQQFLALDTENRGTITHQQMKQVLEESFHVDCNEAETLFHSLDTNHDNEIDYSEFLAAALQARVKVHEPALRRTFQRFDRDETGRITAADLRQVLGAAFEGVDVAELIREADTTGDGKVDYDEFLEFFHKTERDTDASEASDMSCTSRPSPLHPHIEKLGRVVDHLVCQPDSPKTPKPLSRRRLTVPARESSGAFGMSPE